MTIQSNHWAPLSPGARGGSKSPPSPKVLVETAPSGRPTDPSSTRLGQELRPVCGRPHLEAEGRLFWGSRSSHHVAVGDQGRWTFQGKSIFYSKNMQVKSFSARPAGSVSIHMIFSNPLSPRSWNLGPVERLILQTLGGPLNLEGNVYRCL